ncbi:hypothetical protein ACOME3_008262 [Neoechinorhynchus agilis]
MIFRAPVELHVVKEAGESPTLRVFGCEDEVRVELGGVVERFGDEFLCGYIRKESCEVSGLCLLLRKREATSGKIKVTLRRLRCELKGFLENMRITVDGRGKVE